MTSNSGSKLDHIICYGTLAIFFVILLVGARDAYRESLTRKVEKEKWANGCKTAQLAIINRHELTSTRDDYDYRYHTSPNFLELVMNSDQKAVAPNQIIVRVEVSSHVYEHLKERSKVRIYYMPESPLTFLLEEEL